MCAVSSNIAYKPTTDKSSCRICNVDGCKNCDTDNKCS